MSLIYTAISAVLLFWQAAWHTLIGDARSLGTDWPWVLGIVFLVLTVRVLLFPVVVRQVRTQRAVQALQPRIKALRARHGGDRETLAQELTELYRAEGVNPLASLLPLLLQTPILLGLLHVLRHLRPTVTGEGARTLYGWTLTQFGEASHATLFGAPIAASLPTSAAQLQALGTLGPAVVAVAAVLIAAMIVTTYLTSRQMIRKTGWAQDAPGRMVQRLTLYGIPLSLLVSGVIFPIGVVLYWTTQNLFALGQQTWILRRYPPSAPDDDVPPSGQDTPGRPAATGS